MITFKDKHILQLFGILADIDWLLLKVLKYFNNEIFHFDLDIREIIFKVFKYLNDRSFSFWGRLRC
jgi:hypothetical protein